MGKRVHANIISFGISLNLQVHKPKSKVKSMYLSLIPIPNFSNYKRGHLQRLILISLVPTYSPTHNYCKIKPTIKTSTIIISPPIRYDSITVKGQSFNCLYIEGCFLDIINNRIFCTISACITTHKYILSPLTIIKAFGLKLNLFHTAYP